MRAAVRVVLGLALLGALSGCSRGPASPPTAPTPVATGAPRPGPAASRTPGGPLPAVEAELSFSLPGGDAYQPQAVALDEQGQAVVLCYGYGEPATTSALALVDPAQGRRGRLIPLPGRSFGPLAVGAGRAYVGYEDEAHHRRLAAVDLDSGQVLADVESEALYSSNTIIATPAGRLYLPGSHALEVRDGETLQALPGLERDASPGPNMAADLARDRLYLTVGEEVRAYRATDLAPLWQAEGLSGNTHLVADQAGGRIYAQCEGYGGGDLIVQLLAFDARDGRALGPVSVDAEPGWKLVAADSEGGWLVFAGSSVSLWQTGLDGRANGVEATLAGWVSDYAAGGGRLLAVAPNDHLLRILDLASLAPAYDVPLGVELRHVLADPAHERAYANDSAGRVHAIDTRTYEVLSSVDAGRGELTLDAANGLLFAGREVGGHEVSVLSTEPLAATAVITGGYRVAVDSAGRRAFVGWTEMRNPTPGEVQVWNTRTFELMGTIAHRGEPAYNPLRDEVYLQDYSAYIVDGKTLAVTGELTPAIGQTPPGMQGCNSCQSVAHIAVDATLDAVVVSLQTHATGGGPGTAPQPQLFSARTLEPVTHTVTVLPRARGGPGPFILPPDGGRVYEGQQFQRYVVYSASLAYPAGAAEPAEAREGLPLTLYLPGEGIGLSAQEGQFLAFDTTRWQPLGWLPYYGIGEVDLAGRRLYAWDGAQLTVLAFAGAQPEPPSPAEPWQAGAGGGATAVQSIVLSPDYGHDRTVFMVAGGEVLRSTDGGETWLRLRGGLPPSAHGIVASYSLALSPAYGEDHTLFAGGRLGEPLGYGVWRSSDGGETWAPAWQGLEHLRVDRVVVSPGYADDQTLLAYCQYGEFWRAESGRTLYRSSDGGESWVRLETRTSGDYTPLPAPETLLPYPAEAVQFRVAERGDAVERSGDGGESWREVLRRSDPAERPLAVARSPLYEEDGQVFVLFEDRLYRSTDGGDSWQTAANPELVRAEYPLHYTAMAVGEGTSGVALLVGDQSGAVSVLDPSALSWAPAAGPATATPEAQAGPTPCSPPAPPLAAAYPIWAARLGCPSDAGAEVQMAAQTFEHGVMLWRADTREVYVLSTQDGAKSWVAYPDTWEEDQPDRDPALQPPAGLEQPIRGFGKVWREQLGGAQAAIGWALQGERGYGGFWQGFAGGRLVTGPDGWPYALFAGGSWE